MARPAKGLGGRAGVVSACYPSQGGRDPNLVELKATKKERSTGETERCWHRHHHGQTYWTITRNHLKLESHLDESRKANPLVLLLRPQLIQDHLWMSQD
jgi:hypothetical protein